MYESFYGLKEKPFRTVADPGYLYPSGKHKQALTFLEYGLMEDAGIVLLTGEAGSGKTTLIRFILLTLNDMGKDIMPAVVFNVNFSSGAEIVDIVMQSFGLSPKEGKAQSLEKFHAFLRDKLEEGKKVWLVIDEAQNLSREALEEVRMFSNLQSDEKALLHIMLVGQPELRARLRQPEFGSFSQRIAVNYHIEPLTAQEASEYISYRLNKAGGRTDIFEPEAVGLIFQASGGIPRTINLLCDAALVYGFGYELEKIGTSVVEQVIADKGGLGLASAAGEEAVAQGGETRSGHGKDNGLRERIEALEARIGRLQDLVETHMDESNNGAHRFSKDLIDRLTKLLLFERARSDRILSQYKTLYAKYRSLVGKEADKGRPEK